MLMKSPFRILIYDLNNNLVNMDGFSYGICWGVDYINCYKRLQKDESIFGLGENSGQIDKRGEDFVNYNYPRFNEPFYSSVPFYIGLANKIAYGIFVNNTRRTYFNVGKEYNNRLLFGVDDDELNYYFMYGPEIKKVLKIYTDLTGRGELPPKWTLGYHQSKFSYKSDSEVRKIIERLRIRQIPCDSIFLDLHYMNKSKNFTWNRKKFPNPQRLVQNLKKSGFHVTTIIDPWLKKNIFYEPYIEALRNDYLCKKENGKVYSAFNIFTRMVVMPDFVKEEVREWWANKHADLLNIGIDGIWNDKNEPELMDMDKKKIRHGKDKIDHERIHNIFALYELQATQLAFKKFLPNQRPFILTRSGFSGVQKYAAMWTGDIRSRFKAMGETIPMLASMSISGIPFVGADVGGFWSIKKIIRRN